MKKIMVMAISLILMAASQSQAATDEEYTDFAVTLADKAMDTVMEKTDTETKIKNFNSIFKDNCDLNSIGKFVVGQYWKKTSEEQKKKFLETFSNAVIMSWADKFNTFKGGTLSVISVSTDPQTNDTFINSIFKFNDGSEDAKILWRLRDTKAGIKVFDIIIEGISMAMSYRNEYASILQKNDGDISILIDSLQKKTEAMEKAFK